MVPPRSDRVSRAPPYSRMMQVLRIRGCHPLRPAFPDPSASTNTTTGLLRFRSPLLAESPLMSVPPGTEMFQFPGFASCTYVFSARYPIRVGCPIRTPRDQRPLAASPGFSQRATSFIASWRQGIHPMPFSCSSNPSPAMHRNHPPQTNGKHPAARQSPRSAHTKKRLERCGPQKPSLSHRHARPEQLAPSQHSGQTPMPTATDRPCQLYPNACAPRQNPPSRPARPKRTRT